MSVEITTPYEYMCSMSPILKIGAAIAFQRNGTQNDFRIMIESVVNDVAGNKEIADSLKTFVPEMRSLRQVDIRNSPDDPVIFKCFVFWDNNLNVWHVLVEGGLEDYWEKRGKQIPSSVEVN